jgi:hypothetical protein
MDALPVRPQPPQRPAPRPAAPAAGAKRPARAAHAAQPATPADFEALAEQRAFDAIASAQAEQLREMNALRDMAMGQVKRDDQAMNAWIKLI